MEETKVMYPFAVGNSSSDQKASKIVYGLHELVALGKRAQAVLKAIEKQGYYDAEAPYVASASDAGSQSSKYARVEYIRLPKKLLVSRDDLPRLADCTAVIGDPRVVAVKGFEYLQSPLSIHIHGLDQLDPRGSYKPMEFNKHVGELRTNSKGLAYVDPNENVYQIYKSPHSSPGGMDVLKRIASILSEGFVRAPNVPSQKTVDLRRACEGWLMEEGIIARLVDDIRKLQVVRDVLET